MSASERARAQAARLLRLHVSSCAVSDESADALLDLPLFRGDFGGAEQVRFRCVYLEGAQFSMSKMARAATPVGPSSLHASAQPQRSLLVSAMSMTTAI